MLSGDAARAALRDFETPERDRDEALSAKRLGASGLSADILATFSGIPSLRHDLAQRLDDLSPSEREKVLTTLTPHLGRDLARWWEWSAHQPYQRGWTRRAYRSPDRADSLLDRWSDLSKYLSHAMLYPHPLGWQAAWAQHLSEYVQLGSLFASAIAGGDRHIATVMTASIRGEHEISGPSQHAYVALLSSPDPADWAEVERLLAGAQRAEGLRQTILEAADLAHPDAFARLLDLVVEQGLTRFASIVRALSVWIGEDMTVRQEKQVAGAVVAIRDNLRKPPDAEALVDADPIEAFLGLWSLAVRDVRHAIAAAEVVQESANERTRLAAARLLTDFAVPSTAAGLTRAIADSSLPVYAAAVAAWPTHRYGEPAVPMPEAVRANLRERVRSLGKSQEIEIGIVGSLTFRVSGALAADVLIAQPGDSPLDAALLAAASPTGRLDIAYDFTKAPAKHRGTLFSLVADRSSSVREIVGPALQSLPTISAPEALLLEKALTRKAPELRSTALSLLQKQDASALAASVGRLASGTADQRRAADELNDHVLVETPSPDEVPAAIRFTVDDRTPAVRPTAPSATFWEPYHDRFRLLWTSLTAWLAEHSDVEVRTHEGVKLLANVHWLNVHTDGTLPIPEVLGPWWERIQPQLTDGGVEVALLTHLPPPFIRRWATEVTRTVVGPVTATFPKSDIKSLEWEIFHALAVHARRDSWAELIITLMETAAAALPLDHLAGPVEVLERRGRQMDGERRHAASDDARAPLDELFRGSPEFIDPTSLTDQQLVRVWHAARFIDEPEGAMDRWDGPKIEVEVEVHHTQGRPTGRVPVPDQPHRWHTPGRIIVEALQRGAATRADLIDALVLAPTANHRYSQSPRPDALGELTGLRPESWASADHVQAVVSEVRTAAIAAEVVRGDLPSALSETSQGFRTSYGASELMSCLGALGKRPFARAHAWTQSKDSNLSHLVRVNQPLLDDTAELLGRLASEVGVSDHRLIEMAVYAPQWSRLVEQHLGWPGLESAVWWVHAHTVDNNWYVDHQIHAQWATEVSQRTPLEETDLVNGAADVGWFHDIIDTLGEVHFDQVLEAAKYASSSGGHKRAELFATALLGKVDEADLIGRIQGKRHQDSVRALGLLPLPTDKALLDRYELLRAFVASDRTSGSQRRASESAAVDVGLENLARTAGFRDPQRLIWAMEAEAVRDLAQGPITATDGDLVVTLAIDAAGSPQLTVHRAGKSLASVPAKSAKLPEIAALRERAAALRTQIRRMRSSLESACVLADAFEPVELVDLLQHPILAPMLRDIVLVDQGGLVGFPLSGSSLVAADGTEHAATGRLRIAHPVDLLSSGEWPDFQHALMVGERRQPFKQLFRELYTLNENERDEAGISSRRYAGHQVEARRAGGLFTSRGWVADFEQGFSRTFHQQQITAWCHLVNGWGSPTEVEDATIDDVVFHRAGGGIALPLADVPARVFSETMRDLDLVVSVAHAGGVDPETSESSITMRGRLVDETATMLGMTNVEIGGHHVRVRGTLGTYSIHLGSGVVHRVPGNAVCIVPVSAQHRGRIFLPFADDDPRTAEIVAKVVLLARDETIKDPTILQQLLR